MATATQIFEPIASLILAPAAAFFYINAQQQAERLYQIQYPAPQYPVPYSEEERERWVCKKERHLKIFYGFCY